MTALFRTIMLFAMIFLHIVDDYYLQGILAKMKQKSFWSGTDSLYKHDYLVALIEHAFSNTFVMMLPVTVCLLAGVIPDNWGRVIQYVSFITWNTWMHARTDNWKANNLDINLITDQIIHLAQIIVTWLAFFVV